jgi:hypothetical protein
MAPIRPLTDLNRDIGGRRSDLAVKMSEWSGAYTPSTILKSRSAPEPSASIAFLHAGLS